MTKKDFELIARTVLDLQVSREVRQHVAAEFARMLRVTNPRFDESRFLVACGVAK